jgi:penicillin-binding protein 1A
MGVRTPVSSNFAMTLGAPKQGVTPLDMAHAYQTLAERGRFVYSTMSPGVVERDELGKRVPGPAGIKVIGREDDGKVKPIKLPNGEKAESKRVDWPVLKTSVADDVTSMLSTVVTQGTATRAQIPNTFVAGKTGTTENYGDAWFVGYTDKITVAVWVGYPDELRPMQSEFAGQPVAGGTYPAAIWKSFVEKALGYKEYGPDEEEDEDAPVEPSPTTPETPGTTTPETTTPAPDGTAPAEGGGTDPPADAPPQDTAPEETAPPAQQEQPPAQQQQPPAQQAPPSGGTAPPEQ